MIRLMQGDTLAGLLLGDLMVLDECAMSSTPQDDECKRYRLTAGHTLACVLTAEELEHLARGMLALTADRPRKG